MGPVLLRGDLVTGAVGETDRLALVDLLDRLLAGGVVLTGDLVLSVAEVDLVHISLRALITSVREDCPAPW
ncbi:MULTISPECIES: gas vesicle protein [unclassified Amycolatopsis]|uniref:gas vesicle protein n=1 Tax=unclassified Amycolatopsis TaxID=2618356 RepID=UPI00106EB8D4|nr:MULTISPECIES: gas vesicle protein [unclassified Amycolatopsis]